MSPFTTTISLRPCRAFTLVLACAAVALPSPTFGAESRAGTAAHKPIHPPAAARAGSPPRGQLCSCPQRGKKPALSPQAKEEARRGRAMQRVTGAGTPPKPQAPAQLRQQAWLLRRWARYQMAMANPAGRASKPQVLDGWQVRLIDGDTFAYGAERIRIRGIDTPEKAESGGFDASQRLDLLLREGPIVVVPEAVDKYGRVVADVYINGRNVAEVLRSEGHVKPRP